MPGASSSLLPNKYFNNLYVNRLKAIDLKTDNLNDNSDKNKISYLFSIISDSVQITNNSDHLLLKILKSKSNIIEFSDRPFRIVNNNFEFNEFSTIFYLNYDNLKDDPPNIVLSTGSSQQAFELFYETNNSNIDDNIESDITFKLFSLNNQNIIFNTGIYNNISLFIDNIVSPKLNVFPSISNVITTIQYIEAGGNQLSTLSPLTDGGWLTITVYTNPDNSFPPNRINLNYYYTTLIPYQGYIPLVYDNAFKGAFTRYKYKYDLTKYSNNDSGLPPPDQFNFGLYFGKSISSNTQVNLTAWDTD